MYGRAVVALAAACFVGYCVLPDLMERRSPSSLRRAPAPTNGIALTFDDGPNEEITPRILDALHAVGGHATFFLVGQNVRRYPHLVRRMVREGHAIGVHTETHPHAWLCVPSRLRREIAMSFTAIIEASGGKRPLWFRPPYGAFNAVTTATAHRLGLRIALWSCDAGDWLPGASQQGIAARIRHGIQPGAVIDLHDGGRTPTGCRRMADLLPGILDEIVHAGLQPVQLGELVGLPPYAEAYAPS